MDKPWILFSSCCWCLAVVIIIIGALILDDALEENAAKIETNCKIEQAIYDTCTHDCKCYEEYNKYSGKNEEICHTCDDYLYHYTATAIICNTKTNSTIYYTLHEDPDDENGECGTQIQKESGQQVNCWVDCKQKEFTLYDPIASITAPVIMLSVGGVLCLCGAIPPFVMK